MPPRSPNSRRRLPTLRSTTWSYRPTRSSVFPSRLAGEIYTQSQSQNIKTIYSSYTEDVKPINCYNALCRHKDEYIYFNTDHHWTGLGAYYAYQAFCEQTGQQALALTDCTEKTVEGFEGSFYSSDASLSTDTVHYWQFPYQTHAKRQEEPGAEMYETGVYYEGAAGSGAYITFIYGDSSLFIEYNDTNKNGKKIAVVKESYGNAFVPYLTYNYEEVHVIDFRYFLRQSEGIYAGERYHRDTLPEQHHVGERRDAGG